MEHRQSLLKSTTAYFLILLVLFQSCVAYQSTPTTLNSAVDTGPVKLVDNEGRIYKFKNVGLEEGVYVGMGGIYSDLDFIKTADGALSVLDSANFSQVYLKDSKKSKTQSIWLGVAVAAPILFFGLGILALSNMKM